MRSAVIRERPSSVERMHETKSGVLKPRVPQPRRHPRGTRGAAVPVRAPRPLYRIAGVNRDGRRCEKEPTIANRHRDRGAPCSARA
jgi:hypothetical protein